MECDSNQDLLEKIITKLDDKAGRAVKRWSSLGLKLGVSKKKLDVIEYCALFNPTKSLMEYLFAEQNLTVGDFKEKVQQKKELSAALKSLEPSLNGEFVFMQLVYKCMIPQ